MKWIPIKTEDDFPKDANKEVVVRATIGYDDVLADMADHNRIKNLIQNGWKVEWLDESINQDLSECSIACDWPKCTQDNCADKKTNQGGSLKDSDWKEKIRYYASHAYYRGAVDRVTNIASEEAFNKWYDCIIAPLLQNELKGDDLVSSDIKIASPVSTRPSSFTNSMGQVKAFMSKNDPIVAGETKTFCHSFYTTENISPDKLPLIIKAIEDILNTPNTSSQTLTQIEQDKKQTL